jgi:hydroxymethylbilane synthase
MTIRIATRRSALARAQAYQTGLQIAERTGADFELVPMATTGDLSPDRAVADFDTKGLFVDTVRRAVLEGDCDLVIHSFKDLPSDPVEGLALGAVPKRADPRDVLITRDGYAFANLPPTAIIGTSSERRRLQLLKVKPGLQVLPVRGNLDTRLRKVADGELDGVVVALAGMQRLFTSPERGGTGPLGLPLKAYVLEPGECLPAAAQGALAVECRADDDDAFAACKAVNDLPTRAQVTAERAFMTALGGGCLAAVGALCTLTGHGALELIGFMGDPGRRHMVRLSAEGPYKDPEGLGRRLAADVASALGLDLEPGT